MYHSPLLYFFHQKVDHPFATLFPLLCFVRGPKQEEKCAISRPLTQSRLAPRSLPFSRTTTPPVLFSRTVNSVREVGSQQRRHRCLGRAPSSLWGSLPPFPLLFLLLGHVKPQNRLNCFLRARVVCFCFSPALATCLLVACPEPFKIQLL